MIVLGLQKQKQQQQQHKRFQFAVIPMILFFLLCQLLILFKKAQTPNKLKISSESISNSMEFGSKFTQR